MPNRLSRLFSSHSSKEKEAEAEAERAREAEPAPPPSYSVEDPQYDPSDVINPPDETAGFSALSINDQSGSVPEVSQCIAHLKVLECFYRLRQRIGSTDGLFGLDDHIVCEKRLSEEQNGQLLAKIAEKRWAIYVSRAADRFEAWSASLYPGQKMVRSDELEAYVWKPRMCERDATTSLFKIDQSNLPPVDVLMCWHAYMLNPRCYLEDCIRLQRMPMWHFGFPWQAVVDAINSTSFALDASEAAQATFTTNTGLPWHNLDDTSPQTLRCPTCATENQVAYTTCSRSTFDVHLEANPDQTFDALDAMLSNGLGYCDKEFEHECHDCGYSITHDSLKARKYCNDIEACLTENVPMGGTILGTKGMPWAFQRYTDNSCRNVCKFPNDLVKAGLGRNVLEKVNDSPANLSMEEMRNMTEAILADRSVFRLSRRRQGGLLSREQRIGIRKMMSRYWDNHSPFALNFVGAVIRQGSFIEKMHNIDWLHSPALRNTMKRLIIKYERFVTIMKDRSSMAVPTLDVDLAWHTHQLSPYGYMQYTVNVTGQFIDHDDKVAEAKLNDAFAWTTKTYQKLYGEPYSECTCWYCEAIRESQTSTASRLFKSRNAKAEDQLHNGSEQDPRKSVHISAHNAVRPSDATYEQFAADKAFVLEKYYKAACERATKKGRKPPNKDDYYYSDAWGYPCYIPAYSPYMIGALYTPTYYPGMPGCMAIGAGTYGACAAGTCGGAVAAGGCAGNGMGGCAAGVAGGCAAGGAGGCAGGAGGAGGGCGGGGGGGCGGGGGG